MAHYWHTPALADIEAQKHWELEGVERGVRRVRAELDGQRVADSALGFALSQQVVPKLVAEIQSAQKGAEQALIESALSRGRVNPMLYMLMLLPAETFAVIVVKRVMSATPREFTFNQSVTTLGADINRTIRDQLDYEDWRHEDKQYVDRFFANYELSPRNLKRLRDRVGRKRQERWTPEVGIQFGVLLLELLCKSRPEWFRIEQGRLRGGRWEYQLVIAEAAREKLFDLSEQCELSQPALMPTIVPPADWRLAA